MLTHTRAWQHTGFAAYRRLCDRGRNRETGIRHAFMDTLHDFAPDDLMVGGRAADRCNLLIIVTARPDSGCVIRRKAYEPDIVVTCRGAGFSGI